MNAKGMYDNPGERVLDTALRAVARTAGLEGKVAQAYTVTNDHGAYAIVDFTFEHRTYPYLAETRAIDRIERLDYMVNKFKALERVRAKDIGNVLVAPYITIEMAEYCRAQGIQFIDTAGNVYLKADGMYIFVTGHKRNLANVPTTKDRAMTATGMRVVFALLCKPDLLNAAYRDIAAAAGVALGTVGWVLAALQKRGQLLIAARKKRQFIDVKQLIEEWVLNYPIRLRPKLAAQRFHAPAINWWKNDQLKKYGALFGGEVAADILTNYRLPKEVLLYLTGDITPIIVDNKLKADINGEVEIVERFWNFDLEMKEGAIVPPLLVFADLMATNDPRNHEIGKMICDRHIFND